MTDSLIVQYTDCLLQLRTAVEGLIETDLDLAPVHGGWTIRQIVHHLVDGDDLWKDCIKAALGNPQGIFTLQWYWGVTQDVWADKWHYAAPHRTCTWTARNEPHEHHRDFARNAGRA
jgi:hypothetical protein